MFKKILAYILIYLVTIQPLIASSVVIDPSSTGTNLDKAQNGVTVINIAAPNTSGLSHNKFKNYNVDPQGLILNNSQKIATSKLGGALLQNINLKNGEASLILNEVTGVGRSQLNGFTEVFGKKADLVVANPNGITCNGCGFINTGRTTLSTGTPQIEGGTLKRLDVTGGDVLIEGSGLNASEVNYFEIISRTVKLQAQINAQNLSIITGANVYDYQNKTVTAKADNGLAKPEISIDASSLGSIYAGQIKLISTEAGVGVRSNADMVASAGGIQIDSNGNLTYKNLSATKNIDLKAKDVITGNGVAAANGDISISGAKKFINEGKVISEKNLDITVNELYNDGLLSASNSATINTELFFNNKELFGNTVKINSSLNNSGLIEGVNLFIEGDIINTGKLYGYNSLNIQSAYIDNIQGEMLAGIVNKNSDGLFESIKTLGLINIDFTGDLLNLEGKYFATDSIFINAKNLTNNTEIKSLFDIKLNIKNEFINNSFMIAGAYMHPDFIDNWISLGELEIKAGNIINKNTLYASYLLNLDAENNIINNMYLYSDHNLYLKSINDIINSGSILADNSLYVLNAKILNNSTASSQIFSNYGDTFITVQKGLVNKGFIKSGRDLVVEAGNENEKLATITNDYVFRAENKLDLYASNSIFNNYALISQNELKLYAGDKINNGIDKIIFSIGDMELISGNSIINDAGLIKTENGNITITTKNYYNKSYTRKLKDPLIQVNMTPASNGVEQYLLPKDRIYKFTHYPQGGIHKKNQELLDNYGIYEEMYVYSIDAPGNEWRVLGEESIIPGDYFDTYKISRLESGANLIINAKTIINDTSEITATKDIVMNIEKGGSIKNTTYYQEVPLVRLFVKKDADKDHNDEGIDLYLGMRDFEYLKILKDDTEFENFWDSFDFTEEGQTKTLVKRHDNNNPDEQFIEYSYVELLRTYIDTAKETYSEKVYSNKRGKILAGGNIIMQEMETGSGSGFKKDLEDGDEDGGLKKNPAKKLSPEERKTKESDVFYTDIAGDVNTPYVVSTTPTNSEPKVDGIFFKYAKSGATYLVEVNPLFISTEKLMTSDYFLQRIGLSRDQFNILFMGDAYWEKEYIAKQIQDLFNKKFVINGISSDAEQREILLSNAEEVHKDLELSIGIALSAEQIKNLKKPIVWYVEEQKIINGKKTNVLVPKVYVPINSGFEIKNIGEGGVISANNIDIKTSKDILIAGLLNADGTASIKSRNLDLIEADVNAGNLNLDVSQNIDIRGRNYTENEQISEENGFLTSKTSTYYKGTNITAGNLNVKATNLAITGSDLSAENASFDIQKDMSIIAVAETESSVSNIRQESDKSDRDITDMSLSSKLKSSNINIKNNLDIKTGRDLNLLASNITADTASIDAGRDVNVLSAFEEEYNTHREFKKTLLTRETTEKTNYQTNSKGSSINTNSSLDIKAGNNVNLIASEVSSKGSVDIEAENVNMLSVNDIEQNTSYHKKVNLLSISSIFGSIGSFLTGGDLEVGSYKEDTKIEYSEKAVGSSISGGTVNIKTRNDLNMQASTITGDQVGLDVGRDFNMLTAEQDYSSMEENKEGKIFVNVDISGISSAKVQAGVKYHSEKESLASTTHVGSAINAENLKIKTGRDFTSAGSDINVIQDAIIEVGGTSKSYGVMDTSTYSNETLDIRTGVEIGVSVNPLKVVDGVKNVAQGAAQGAKSVASIAQGDLSGTLNNSFGGINQTMAGAGQINQARSRVQEGVDKGKLETVGMSVNYFLEVDSSKTSSTSSTVKSSNLNVGGKLTATVANDMIMHGANMNVGEADIDVKGNLDIQSMYDYSSYEQTNISAGLSIGIGGSSVGQVNSYVNASQTNSESAWVQNQSGINSGGKLNIKVGDNTNLQGTYLNSDSGELNLETKTLTYSDMLGYDKSTTIGGGTSAGVSYNPSAETPDYNFNAPSRTNIKYGMHDKEQLNRATIGDGNITVGDKINPDLSGLNRDITKSQEIIKDKRVDLIDVDVDHRLLSKSGRQQMKDEIVSAAATVKDNAAVLGKVITGDSSVGKAGGLLAYNYNKEDVIVKMAEGSKEDKLAIAILQNPNAYSQQEIDSAQTQINQKLMQEYGYKPEELKEFEIYAYNDAKDNAKGFREKTDANKGEIGINLAQTGKGTEEYYATVEHEAGHAVGSHLGFKDKDSEEFARNTQDLGLLAIDNGLWMAGLSSVSYTPVNSPDKSYLNIKDFEYSVLNNQKASNVIDKEYFIETAFDAASLGQGIYSISQWNENTSIFEKTLDVGGVALDAGALAVPFIPGGVSLGIKAIKAGEKASDAAKTIEKVDVVSGVNKRKVVIGENMQKRIIPAAKEQGATYYKPRSTNKDNWMKNNEAWINREIKKEAEFLDIGIDPARVERSPYYEMEKKILSNKGVEVKKIK